MSGVIYPSLDNLVTRIRVHKFDIGMCILYNICLILEVHCTVTYNRYIYYIIMLRKYVKMQMKIPVLPNIIFQEFNFCHSRICVNINM